MTTTKFGLDQQAIGKAGGTEDMTETSFGTCNGAITFGAKNTALDTHADHAQIAIGSYDGTTDLCNDIGSEHGTSGSNTGTCNVANRCMRFGDDDAPNINRDGHFAGDSFITDGVRLNVGNTFADNNWITALLVACAEFNTVWHVDPTVDDQDANSVPHGLTGGAPDAIIAIAGHERAFSVSDPASGSGDARLSIGFVANRGASVQQACGAFGDANGVNPCAPEARVTATRFLTAPNAKGSFECTGLDATNLDYTYHSHSDNCTPCAIQFIFLRFDDGAEANVGVFDTPTGVGTEAETGLDVDPDVLFLAKTMVGTLDTDVTGAFGGSFGFGVATATAESSMAVAVNTTATSDTSCVNDDELIELPYAFGTTGYRGSLSSFDAGGFTLQFDNVTGFAHKWPYLVVGQPTSTGVSGTLDAALPLPSGDTNGAVDVSGVLDAPLPLPSGASVGSVDVSGALDAPVPLPSGDIDGTVGEAAITGALDAPLPLPSGASVGSVDVSGALDASVPLPSGALVGDVGVSGTLDAALPLPSGDIDGTVDEAAITGALDAPLPLPSGEVLGHTFARTCDFATVKVTTPASPGTLDVTVPGFNCVGAKIVCSWATALDTAVAGRSFSYGVTDGTTDVCSFSFSKDNVATSDARCGGSNLQCVLLRNPDTAGFAVLATASLIAGGIRLDFSITAVQVQLEVVLIDAANFKIGTSVSQNPHNNTDNVVVGWQPDVIEFMSLPRAFDGVDNQTRVTQCHGWCDTRNLKNRHYAFYEEDNHTNPQATIYADEVDAGSLKNLDVSDTPPDPWMERLNSFRVTAVDATSFTVTHTADAGALDVHFCWIAYDIGNDEFAAEFEHVPPGPGGEGLVDFQTPGFQPYHVELWSGEVEGLGNLGYDLGDGVPAFGTLGIGYGSANAYDEASVWSASEYEPPQGPTNTGSRTSSEFVQEHTMAVGDFVLIRQASFNGWLADGVQVDFSVNIATGNDVYWLLVAFGGEGSRPVDGTLDASLPLPIGAVQGEVSISGALDAALPLPSGDAEGDVLVGGALDAALPLLSGGTVGDVLITGTLDASLPLPSGDVTGQVDVAGALDASLPIPSGDVLGSTLGSGTLDADLSLLAGDVDGAVLVSGTLDASLSTFEADLVAQVDIAGQTDVDLPLPAGDAIGQVNVAGDLDASLSLPEGGILGQTGELSSTGTLDAEFPLPEGDTLGDVLVLGTLDAALSSPSGDTQGDVYVLGSLDAGLFLPLGDIEGQVGGVGIEGTLDAALPLLSGGLEGDVLVIGTLDAALPLLSGGLEGDVLVIGTLDAALALPVGDVTGQVDVAGALDASLPLLSGDIDGQIGEVSVEGVLDAALPLFSGDVVGDVPVLGNLDASTTLPIGGVTGTVLVSGSLDATLPLLNADIEGQVGDPAITGTLDVALPLPSSDIVSSVLVAGTLDAPLLLPSGEFVGQASISGTLDAALLLLEGAILGQVGELSSTGPLDAPLPLPAGATAGVVLVNGDLDSSLPLAASDVVGQTLIEGVADATLPLLSGGIEGAVYWVEIEGTADAILPLVSGSISGQVAVSGSVDVVLPLLSGDVAGSVTVSGDLDALLPVLEGSLEATVSWPDITGDLDTSLPLLAGDLTGSTIVSGSLDASLLLPLGDIDGSGLVTGDVDASLLLPSGDIVGGIYSSLTTIQILDASNNPIASVEYAVLDLDQTQLLFDGVADESGTIGPLLLQQETSYPILLKKVHASFTVPELIETGTEVILSVTFGGDELSIIPSVDPTLCRVQGVIIDLQSQPLEGVDVTVQNLFRRGPSYGQTVVGGKTVVETNAQGQFTIDLVRGTAVVFSLQNSNTKMKFSVPDQSTFTLDQLWLLAKGELTYTLG